MSHQADRQRQNNDQAAVLVTETLRRWYRRAVMICLLGLLLFGAFIVAANFLSSTQATVNRRGIEVPGVVKEVDPTGRQVTVQYQRDGTTTQLYFKDLPVTPTTLVKGQTVRLSVNRDSDRQTLIIGTKRSQQSTSIPVAALLVASVLVFGMGLFELQATIRCRKYIGNHPWRTMRWRGLVYGPGRGRVRAAGWLEDVQSERQHLMVNARGCWRKGVDLLAETTDLSVAGNPVGIVTVRHMASLHVVLLRPPRGDRERQRALSLIATGKG